jgi:hypothetical protein
VHGLDLVLARKLEYRINPSVANFARTLVCEPGKSKSLASLEDVSAMDFVTKHWVARCVGGSTIRWRQGLETGNTISTHVKCLANYTCLGSNVRIKVLRVIRSLQLGLEWSLPLMYACEIDRLEPGMGLKVGRSCVLLVSITVIAIATHLDIIGPVQTASHKPAPPVHIKRKPALGSDPVFWLAQKTFHQVHTLTRDFGTGRESQ